MCTEADRCIQRHSTTWSIHVLVDDVMVDIVTYRARIGCGVHMLSMTNRQSNTKSTMYNIMDHVSLRHSVVGVLLLTGFFTIGTVDFVDKLQLQSGIETNPGPYDYDMVLATMSSIRSFDDIFCFCTGLTLPTLPQFHGNQYLRHYRCDRSAMSDLPMDCPMPVNECFAVRTPGYGNCFPAALSLLVYGNEHHAVEMRVRIVQEAVVNIDYYLNADELFKGQTHEHCRNGIATRYCSYSHYFEHNMLYTDENIRQVYINETMGLRTNYEWCGIWQFHQAANVLQCPLYSIYPGRIIESIWKDLNRCITPKTLRLDAQPCHILWTKASVVAASYNHFVPIVRYV